MLYVTSDLHYGLNAKGDAATRQLAASLEQARPWDVLALAGDLGVDDETLAACLHLFRDFPGQKIAVAGNHDVWVARGDDSWARLARVQDIFRRAGFHALEDGPVTVGETSFVGTMGWYDYSFRDDIGIPAESYHAKRDRALKASWGDAIHACWNQSDESMTDYFLHALQRQLDALTDTREIIAILHHVPTKALLFHPRWFLPKYWRFLNAFLGSSRFEALLSLYPKVTHAFCGHIHRGAETVQYGTRYVSVGSDYEPKQLVTLDHDKRLFRKIFTS